LIGYNDFWKGYSVLMQVFAEPASITSTSCPCQASTPNQETAANFAPPQTHTRTNATFFDSIVNWQVAIHPSIKGAGYQLLCDLFFPPHSLLTYFLSKS
jgi:hypothetical protein